MVRSSGVQARSAWLSTQIVRFSARAGLPVFQNALVLGLPIESRLQQFQIYVASVRLRAAGSKVWELGPAVVGAKVPKIKGLPGRAGALQMTRS